MEEFSPSFLCQERALLRKQQVLDNLQSLAFQIAAELAGGLDQTWPVARFDEIAVQFSHVESGDFPCALANIGAIVGG